MFRIEIRIIDTSYPYQINSIKEPLTCCQMYWNDKSNFKAPDFVRIKVGIYLCTGKKVGSEMKRLKLYE